MRRQCMGFEDPGLREDKKGVGGVDISCGDETEGKAVGWFSDVEGALGVDNHEDFAGCWRWRVHCWY